MMKIFKLLSIALTIVLGISSCSDENSTIGSSIVDTQLEIVVDSTFADLVTVKSVANDSIVGRTTNQMIGRITIPGYGRLESDFLTQFMPASTLDTMSVVRLDSLMLYLNFNDDSFTGDSLAPMRLAIYELDGQLSSPIYSNIDPTRYYDKQAAPIASKSYNASYLGQPDSLMKLGYKRIPVRLPDEMMNDVWNKYQEEPAIFSSPRLFTQYFPGFYIKNDYGSGCVVNIQNASINLHYTKKAADKDSTYAAVQSIMGVTSEVVTGNHITVKQDPQIALDTT